MSADKRSRVGWQGYIPAITTPFDKDHRIDETGFGALLDWLCQEGMHGLVVAGTTGEWTSLTADERIRLFDLAGSQVGGRIPVIGGCSALTLRESVAFAQAAAAAGLDGILVTPPPYIRPNDDEIFGFYQQLGREISLPLCIYNWPPGTGIDMTPDLLCRLAEIDAVVAIKQSTSQFMRFVDTFFALKDKVRVFGFPMDEIGLSLLRTHGGDGTMGAGGVLGRIQSGFYDNLWKGDIDAARACGRKDRALMEQWYTPELVGRFGSGPAILKAALNARGVPGGHVRPPLLDVSAEHEEQIRATLRSLGAL
ncbi:MAG: dihydrodipicolinate synthase family protein [Sphingobium sp.]